MADRNPTGFGLDQTYVFLEKDGATPLISAAAFWKSVMSSESQENAAARDGWLVASYRLAEDTSTLEMHPFGGELLVMLSGAMQVIIETADAEVIVDLSAGKACLVPQGVWHRLVVRDAGEFIGATYGKGTQHRPRSI
jgi:mannose-6-phosphate isomerase-like protein (cupin superfamily)